jgi:MFS family permease
MTTDRGPGRPALVAVLAGNMLIDALEVSTQVVAMPAIARDLGLGAAGAQWTVSAFAVGFGGAVLAGGRLVETAGRRRVYLAALVVFAAASVVAGLTGSFAVLLATRAVKGICVALTAPTGLAILVSAYPPGPARQRAVSVYTLFGAVGFTLGLLVSGALTSRDWHLTMAFPAPAMVVLFVAGLLLLPADPPAGPRPPWPLRAVLGNGTLVRSALSAAALNGSYLGLLTIVTFQLQDGAGWTPARTALGLTVAAVPLAVAAPFAGRLVARVGAPRLIAAGLLCATAGYLRYPHGEPPGSYATGVLPTLVLVGAAFVLAFTALNVQAMSRIAAPGRGVAAGVFQTAVQCGAIVLVPLVGVLLAAHTPTATWVVTAVGGAGLLVACAGLPTRSPLVGGEADDEPDRAVARGRASR